MGLCMRYRFNNARKAVTSGNPSLVTTSVRNRPPFTLVHNHAAAQNLSGRLFAVSGRQSAAFWPGGRRNALRGSQGVRPRDVMFNKAVWQTQAR
nr:hypothetical protein [uncultured bacterium]